MCELVLNPRCRDKPEWAADIVAPFLADDILPFHQSLPGYASTPLVRLGALAHELGISSLLVKDESHRFGLKAFKSLGASYAIYRFLKDRWEQVADRAFTPDQFHSRYYRDKLGEFTFATATDGNHGHAVAWTARLLGEKAVIYMPADSVGARVEAIRSEGAEVILVDGTYDECVARAQRDAAQHGWQVISDTSYEGYMTIPRYIMAGYTTMFREISEALSPEERDLDLVIVQAGVGSLLAAVAWFYAAAREKRPRIVAVESSQAACVAESVKAGSPTTATGSLETIMAGLNCGTVSIVAWPLIEQGVDAVVTLSDDYAREAMRRLCYPQGDDPQIISGESGAAGLAALLALRESPSLVKAREQLGIADTSRVLLLNTEGDTDPGYFQQVVGEE